MKTTNFIQQLIAHNQFRKEQNSKYKIEDLYIGQIISFDKNKYSDAIKQRLYYKEIKAFAIFYKKDENSYVHIKSGHELISWDSANIEGDYSIRHLIPFGNFYAIASQSSNVDEKTKLTKSYIEKLETDANKKFAPKQQSTDLFGI